MVATGVIWGFVNPIVNPATWQFAGGRATVTTTASQRITAVAGAALGLAAGSAPTGLNVDLCYQQVPGGAVTNFGGALRYLSFQFTTTRQMITVANAVMPGAGTWNVGLCLQGYGVTVTVSNNDYVSGWVQVTN